MTRLQELGKLFFGQLQRIAALDETVPNAEIYLAQYQLLQQLFVAYTQHERLHFTTLFARMAYALQQSQASPRLTAAIHRLRKKLRQEMDRPIPTKEATFDPAQGIHILSRTIAHLFDLEIPSALEPYLAIPLDFQREERRVDQFQGSLRLVLIGMDKDEELLFGRQSEAPEIIWKVHYNIAERNENFNPTIQAIESVLKFPVTVQLLDTEQVNPDRLYPRGIILEPDYLMDVSAVAECFKPTGPMPTSFLLKKFLPFEPSIPLLIGNIANF
ncbi:MAG: hypothetical protein KDC44_20910, partial [Phaeodactylibacter sp.]|nr:hypothetical protein [Phaeodactylibacter sp.]